MFAAVKHLLFGKGHEKTREACMGDLPDSVLVGIRAH